MIFFQKHNWSPWCSVNDSLRVQLPGNSSYAVEKVGLEEGKKSNNFRVPGIVLDLPGNSGGYVLPRL